MMVKPKPFLHTALLIVVICEINLIMSLMPADRSITEGRQIFIAPVDCIFSLIAQ